MLDLDRETIWSLRERLLARSLSAVELVSAVLGRLAASEPYIHAYVHVLADEALDAARLADDELARGCRKPLLGIPIGVKDVFWTRGTLTEAGSRILEGFRPTRDAAAVKALRDAGAIIVGKQATPEFTIDPTIPASRNAWNLSRYAGGSSAGAGNSVSVGSALAAIGTDAGGSIRKPAALNGVVGLKPTYDLISRDGITPPSGTMDTVGIVARTADDCQLLLATLLQKSRLSADPSRPDGSTIKPARVGIAPYFFDECLERAARDAIEAALQELQRLGAEIIPIEIPSLQHSVAAGMTIVSVEGAQAHLRWLKTQLHQYGPETRRALMLGLLIPQKYVTAAKQIRAQICKEFRAAFLAQKLDAIAAPTVPYLSTPVELMSPANYPHDHVLYTIPANVAGLPAISVPCGLAHGDEPIGFQLIGRPWGESTLLRLASAYQQVTHWHELRPPAWWAVDPIGV